MLAHSNCYTLGALMTVSVGAAGITDRHFINSICYDQFRLYDILSLSNEYLL